jgi:RNA:NAD 2'-phosphotransferase (TPT1/KptA family)
LNNPVAKYMMDTSPQVNIIPKKLYHATPNANLKGILSDGLKPSEIFGQSYFCKTTQQCLQFFNGQEVYLLEIDTSELKKDLFRYSLDHNQNFFPFDCYAYYGAVPTHLIKVV